MRQHVDTAASARHCQCQSDQQPQRPRASDVNTALGGRGFESSNKQIGAGRPVTGRVQVWNGNAGRALQIDPSDQTQIDHDQL